MPPTIKDVARIACVSPSTVSRVIADHPLISAATKERVRAAMRDLDYHPNAIARSLVRQSSHTLGLILSRSAEQAFLNPFFPEIIRGISSVAREHQYSLLLSTSKTIEQEHAECLQMLHARRVDGVILLASRRHDALVERLLLEKHPFVVVGRVPGQPGVSWVNNDNVAAAEAAVKHLVEAGRRRVGFIGGPDDFVVTEDRLEGYKRALQAAGIEFDAALVRYTDFSKESGENAAASLVSLPLSLRPTAIFAADDLLALGALLAGRAAGLRIPENLALVGFNDNPIASYLEPGLTSVQISIFDLGQRAAELLIALLRDKGGSPAQVILPARLVVRGSSALTA